MADPCARPTGALTLDALIGGLAARTDGRALIEQFVPPPRFADKRFDGYRPDPQHPSQAHALGRLRAVAAGLQETVRDRLARRIRSALGRSRRGHGIYLDGGFGVGKTHLLAALWNAAPPPRAYLSFDELVYTIGLLGVAASREAFAGFRLVAVDEWELDDPGNLQMAVAFLRGALADGVQVVTTSNTVPDELGRGRFPQKDFAAEIAELASAFEVLRIEGEDFRHRHYAANPGREYFLDDAALARRAVGGRTLRVRFAHLLEDLSRVHPIRYAALARRLDGLLVERLATITQLPQALRWVHFIDKLYDAAVPLAVSSEIPLSALFPEPFVRGPYGKKISRCLSRLEELLAQDGSEEPAERSP